MYRNPGINHNYLLQSTTPTSARTRNCVFFSCVDYTTLAACRHTGTLVFTATKVVHNKNTLLKASGRNLKAATN